MLTEVPEATRRRSCPASEAAPRPDRSHREKKKRAARFADQRERVVQLLKDWRLRYSTSRGSAPDADAFMFVSKEGLSGGAYPLNAEVFKCMGNSRYAKSIRLLEKALKVLAHYEPLPYLGIRRVFLSEDAGDTDYDLLRQDAREDKEAGSKENCKQANVRRHLDLIVVDRGIDALTEILEGHDLYAVFGERMIRKTHRRQTTEESYHEIYRVYKSWHAELSKKKKRCKYDAIANTIIAFDNEVSERTVERAIDFVESSETHWQEAAQAEAETAECRRKVSRAAKKARRYQKVKCSEASKEAAKTKEVAA